MSIYGKSINNIKIINIKDEIAENIFIKCQI